MLHASGAELTGGDGGFGGADWDLFPVFDCGDGGDGGSGISDNGGALALGASALDLAVQPGLAGLGYLG